MADWGLYSALRYQDDWATRRQDKMVEMQVLEKMQGIAEKDLQQQQQMEAGLVDYMDKIKQMNTLAKDQEKLNQLYREEMKTIVKGISNVNGDLRKYMMSGGITQLNNFKNAIVNSELAKQAQVNKLNYDAAVKAMQEGKHLAPSIVRYRGNDGEIKEGLATWQQQMALFEQNRIDQITFSGATDPIKVDPKLFFDNVKDPNNPYYAHDVTWDDFHKAATAMGAPDWYAHELANDYIQTGQTWKWKALDPLDAQVKLARASAYRASAARDRAATEQYLDVAKSLVTGAGLTLKDEANIGGNIVRKFAVPGNFQGQAMQLAGLRVNSKGELELDENGYQSLNNVTIYNAETMDQITLSQALISSAMANEVIQIGKRTFIPVNVRGLESEYDDQKSADWGNADVTHQFIGGYINPGNWFGGAVDTDVDFTGALVEIDPGVLGAILVNKEANVQPNRYAAGADAMYLDNRYSPRSLEGNIPIGIDE